MTVTENQIKIIAIGLLPIFIIFAVTLPESLGITILLGCIVITALVAALLGRSLQKKEAGDPDNLLAIPPKSS